MQGRIDEIVAYATCAPTASRGGERSPCPIVHGQKDEIDMDVKVSYIEEYIRIHRNFSFRELLEKQHSKMEIIVTFLVILELMKVGKISIVQEDTFQDIIITSKVA